MIILLAKGAVMMAILMTAIAYAVWIERRIVARMQSRLGPNRVGFGVLATLPFIGEHFRGVARFRCLGLGQPVADAVKLFLKELVMPAAAEPWSYSLAPIIACVAALLGFAVVPWGPDLHVAGHTWRMQLADPSVGILFLLAASGLGVYGLFLAGWAAGGAYSLLGGLRAAAQLLSCELPLGLALLAASLSAGSLSLREITAAQGGLWLICSQPLAFLIALIALVAEARRAPFDLPEAESELVAGYFTEYSGMRLALFFIAEYAHVFLGSMVLVTVFCGGWHVPGLAPSRTPWLLGCAAFAAKTAGFVFGFIWLRATLPRLRYDQLMSFCWKILLPLAALNLVGTALFGGR